MTSRLKMSALRRRTREENGNDLRLSTIRGVELSDKTAVDVEPPKKPVRVPTKKWETFFRASQLLPAAEGALSVLEEAGAQSAVVLHLQTLLDLYAAAARMAGGAQWSDLSQDILELGVMGNFTGFDALTNVETMLLAFLPFLSTDVIPPTSASSSITLGDIFSSLTEASVADELVSVLVPDLSSETLWKEAVEGRYSPAWALFDVAGDFVTIAGPNEIEGRAEAIVLPSGIFGHMIERDGDMRGATIVINLEAIHDETTLGKDGTAMDSVPGDGEVVTVSLDRGDRPIVRLPFEGAKPARTNGTLTFTIDAEHKPLFDPFGFAGPVRRLPLAAVVWVSGSMNDPIETVLFRPLAEGDVEWEGDVPGKVTVEVDAEKGKYVVVEVLYLDLNTIDGDVRAQAINSYRGGIDPASLLGLVRDGSSAFGLGVRVFPPTKVDVQ